MLDLTDPVLQPARQVLRALEAAPSLTDGLRIGARLVQVARTSADPVGVSRMLDGAVASAVAAGDALVAIMGVHALAGVRDDAADAALVRLVLDAERPLAGHAAWAMAERLPNLAVVDGLADLIVAGGFEAFLAQRTLVRWSTWAEQPIAAQLRRRLAPADPAAGGRLLDTLAAARARTERPARRAGTGASSDTSGITIVQPFLHARLDAAGSSLGAGDAGGIASLLWSLGSALPDHPVVDEVITVTRAHPVDGDGEAGFEDPDEPLAPGHRLARIRYGDDASVPLTEAWAHHLSVERELHGLAASLTGPVVWHLRMADVGTLAAAAVARRFGDRVVFTVAPDPHAVIAADERAGRIDRARFGAADAAGHLVFRARLVEAQAATADHVVALPRPGLRGDLADLLGLDVDDPRHPVRVIPEGVDTAALDRAADEQADRARPAAAVRRVQAAIPPDRRHLPWLLTVGRLHPLKGVHRLVAAWASTPALAERTNLVVVGGGLDDPSPVERTALELITEAAGDPGRAGLVLTGQVPPAEVAELLVHAAADRGAYVAAGDKEEFGLAIVSALGAGLVVVAPQVGGASTYIEQGVTGLVTDTASVPALAAAIEAALALADDDGRRDRARSFVRAELSVATMAARLGDLYTEVAGLADQTVDATTDERRGAASGATTRPATSSTTASATTTTSTTTSPTTTSPTTTRSGTASDAAA